MVHLIVVEALWGALDRGGGGERTRRWGGEGVGDCNEVHMNFCLIMSFLVNCLTHRPSASFVFAHDLRLRSLLPHFTIATVNSSCVG